MKESMKNLLIVIITSVVVALLTTLFLQGSGLTGTAVGSLGDLAEYPSSEFDDEELEGIPPFVDYPEFLRMLDEIVNELEKQRQQIEKMEARLADYPPLWDVPEVYDAELIVGAENE